MMQQKPTIHVIGAACGLGAENPGCSLGPIIMQTSSFLADLPFDLNWQAMLYVRESASKLAAIPAITDFCEQLAEEACSIVANKKMLLTLGGDQSCSMGTWSGVAAAIKKQGDLGLIWVDAHMDSHTPENSRTKNIHGMPLAALLGYGADELTHIMYAQPKLKPQHLCLIGVRSYELEEKELLEKLGVRIFFMEEVAQKGITTVMQEALAIVKQGTASYGISIDLDGMDPKDAPGVGTPASNGINANEFLSALNQLKHDPKLIAAEIVEFNPNLDQERKTEKLISDILKVLF